MFFKVEFDEYPKNTCKIGPFLIYFKIGRIRKGLFPLCRKELDVLADAKAAKQQEM